MKHSYFLIYRRLKSGPWTIDKTKPLSGLVMKPKRVCAGVTVPDFGLAMEIASIRVHCAPYEQLAVMEVTEDREKQRARRLHLAYEREMNEFLELMEA